jgi:hypothetical protein
LGVRQRISKLKPLAWRWRGAAGEQEFENNRPETSAKTPNIGKSLSFSHTDALEYLPEDVAILEALVAGGPGRRPP